MYALLCATNLGIRFFIILLELELVCRLCIFRDKASALAQKTPVIRLNSGHDLKDRSVGSIRAIMSFLRVGSHVWT